ncbi:M1 family aminopeptidase [Arcanobacterium hippocoleae]
MGKYDSVFVPEYNLGAMENPGCVTFNENAYIHRGHTTRSQAAGRGNTILHEMSHMWFGDLVTPKWWNDLWLKESFAEFMGAWGLVESTKYKEAWQNFAGARLSWALANDQYPTTHPVIAEVPDLEAADQVFDGITYAKGAAVLRQLVAWVGEEEFFPECESILQNMHSRQRLLGTYSMR